MPNTPPIPADPSANNIRLRVAVVGSGPAGMMAATRLSENPNLQITVFEKRPSLGRKLLIAGSSGLNISYALPLADFVAHYRGFAKSDWVRWFKDFGQKDWIQFIETGLGLETFKGTSDRYFVKEMKASGLLKRWTDLLRFRGVTFTGGHELLNFETLTGTGEIELTFKGQTPQLFDAVILALGGGSWEKEPLNWMDAFTSKAIPFEPFAPSNVGYEVDFNPAFLREVEGKPLKKIVFHNSRGSKPGELVVTRYGLEGTPVYFLGQPGPITLDLLPDLTEFEVLSRLKYVKENLSPLRRVKRALSLCEASSALLFHELSAVEKSSLEIVAKRVKAFPLVLTQPRPLEEAISSKGGVGLSALSPNLELKLYPNIYCIGEMLAWDAPTGGFLIQACVTQGAVVAKALAAKLGA